MFEITEDTRNAAIEAMKDILPLENCGATEEQINASVGEAFDKAVEIVKSQFGM